MKTDIQIQKLPNRYPHDKRCRVLGLTAEKLEATKTGISKDEWENLSEIPHSMGNVMVWWSYREQPDSLGNAAAVAKREDADRIEIGLVSVVGWDEAECLQHAISLEVEL